MWMTASPWCGPSPWRWLPSAHLWPRWRQCSSRIVPAGCGPPVTMWPQHRRRQYRYSGQGTTSLRHFFPASRPSSALPRANPAQELRRGQTCRPRPPSCAMSLRSSTPPSTWPPSRAGSCSGGRWRGSARVTPPSPGPCSRGRRAVGRTPPPSRAAHVTGARPADGSPSAARVTAAAAAPLPRKQCNVGQGWLRWTSKRCRARSGLG
mmetsp:Transcript_4232/g.10740  ORF Transcript_4232/g.10740 Transcript_4232/m.10740 type:complete len:207 (+) Transcript_4232:376-996(+)